MPGIQCPVRRGHLARVQALLCLVVVLVGPAQVFPGLLAVGAALEGSHTVRVGSDGSDFRLALSHERGQAGRPDYNPRHSPRNAGHHHGLATAVLCWVADNDGREPDHVARFTLASAWEEPQQTPEVHTVTAGQAQLPQPLACISTPVAAGNLKLLPFRDHGPPGGTGLLSLLRSTVLLI